MNVLEKILEEIEEKFKTADAEKCDCEELCDVEDWYDSGYIDGQLSAHEKCMDIIRSHMDEAKDINVPSNDGWIQVEDGLPEVGENDIYDMQLVTLEDGEVCLGVYHNLENEWWTRRQEGETLYTNKRNVVAWQPLPEPYRHKDIPTTKNTQQEMEDF